MHIVAENIRLKIGVGDFADDDEFADKYFRRNGKILRARGHNDTDIRNDIEINGVLGWVDAHTFKGGRKIA